MKAPLLMKGILAGAFCVALALPTSVVAGHPGYRMYNIVKLGGDGGWDYLNIDPASGKLYVTRGTHVMVIDPANGKVVADIEGLQGVHGTAFTNGRAYITEGASNQLAVIDTKTYAKLSEISVGTRPDGVLYDPATRYIFTFNGGSSDATAVDSISGKVIGTVALGGKPEAAVSDAQGTIFVNIEDKSELVAFDAAKLIVKAVYPLAPCESPSGMAADIAHRRIFSGCENKIVAVTDMKTGKVVTTFPIGEGVDANRFDPSTGLVFSSNGKSGTLTVALEESPDSYMVMQNVLTDSGARTMELDPKTHIAYLVTSDLKPGTPTADKPSPRPVPVPGTFRLLIVRR